MDHVDILPSIVYLLNALDWNPHQLMMNNRFVIHCLVAMSLTAMWHLEWMSTTWKDRDNLRCTVITLGIVTVRWHCVVGDTGQASWMMVVVEEDPCGLLMASKMSISIWWCSLWAWPVQSTIKQVSLVSCIAQLLECSLACACDSLQSWVANS